jgi:hypothetical protein
VTLGWQARAPARAAMAVLAAVLALSGSPTASAAATAAPTTRTATGTALAAPMPDPAVVAQGVSSANTAHLFKSPAWDFATMRAVFNAVALLPGDQTKVTAARSAGLAVVLEFDYKADFFAGKDISAKVAAVAEQIRANPGTISAVHVADRLNEKYSAAQGLRYLAATGGVLHRLVPGVPVLVNASDWELTCDLPQQSSCTAHSAQFQYETNATLDAFARSGYLDGINIADNIKNLDSATQQTAWSNARARWPKPFLLWATCSQLSFGQQTYPADAPAEPATRTYMLAPLAAGADGVALWAWHQLYRGAVDSFLNKDGSSNAMWSSMTSAARRIASTAPSNRADLAAIPIPTPSTTGNVLLVLFAVLAGLLVLVPLLVKLAGTVTSSRSSAGQNSSA